MSESVIPAFQLQKLSEKHRLIASLVCQGIDRAAIAAASGYTPEYITMLKNQPLFIQAVREITSASAVELEGLFPMAVDIIKDTMESGNFDEKLRGARLQMEATGRIGKYRAEDDVPKDDRLGQLAERLVNLLQDQRRSVHNGSAEEVPYQEIPRSTG